MRHPFLNLCFTILMLPTSNVTPATAQEQRTVTISTQKDHYLLGEPVLLDFSYKNVTGSDKSIVEFWPRPLEPPIHIYISHDGVEFRRFRFGYLRGFYLPQKMRVLKPGETWKQQLHLLYSRADPGSLAFEKPGKYFIKTGDKAGNDISWHAESNTIKVEIKEPKGLDAKVWQRMRDKRLFSLIQAGFFSTTREDKKNEITPPWADRETVARLAALLKESPESRYADVFRSVLQRVYLHQGSQLSGEERERIRHVLGLSDVIDLPDRRLDTLVFGVREKDMLVGELLATLSAQCQIRLDATAELKKVKVRLGLSDRHLRTVMNSLSLKFTAPWWAYGDGFFLSAKPLAAPANPKDR